MCDDVSGVEKELVSHYTINASKDTTEKNICNCNLIQFTQQHVMLKSCITCCTLRSDHHCKIFVL